MAISLAPNALQDFEHFCRHYGLSLAHDVTLERVMQTDFWAHVGGKLRPFDRITLMAEDRTWMAELVVLSAGKGFARMHLLQRFDLVESADELEAGEADALPLTVKWNGPAEKWVVIRKADQQKLKVGMDSKTDAESFALNYRRAA